MTVQISGTQGYIADFSNATVSSRQSFQTSTTNGTTGIYALPNGTATAASWQATNAADPTNASKILIATNGSTDVQLVSGKNGTGTYLPLTFYTNGSEQMRLDTSGTLYLGATSGYSGKLVVIGTPAATSGALSYIRDTTASGANTSLGSLMFASSPGTDYYIGKKSENTVGSLVFGNANTGAEYARIDSSGNLGLGVTPSAWASGWKALQIANGSSFVNNGATNYTGIFQNAYYNGTNNLYLASTYALKYELVNGTHAWYNSAVGTAGGTISWTQAMTLDASGNLGVGTTSPLSVTGSTYGWRVEQLYSATDAAMVINGNGGAGRIHLVSGVASANQKSWGISSYNGSLLFASIADNLVDTERARIDSSGHLLVGQTSTSLGTSQSGVVVGQGYRGHAGYGGAEGATFNIYWTGSAAQLWIDTTNNGTITTSSDYRIKKNVETQTATALDRVAQIRPVLYEFADNEQLSWKADGIQREGFIAHELQAIIPSAVEGEKDVPNQIQSLRLDALCSVLVKAIQEQQAIIESLKARLDAANI